MLTRTVLCRSAGRGRGDSVGLGRTRDVDETSWRVILAGLIAGSMNGGHSSNVFRISISYN